MQLVQNLKESFLKQVIHHPKKVILLALGFVFISSLGLTKLGQEYSHRIWFLEGDPHLEEFDRFKERFGNDENIILVYHHKEGIYRKSSLDVVSSLTDLLWKTPNVVRVDSLYNFSVVETKDDDISIYPFGEDGLYQEGELTRRIGLLNKDTDALNYVVSQDGKTTVLYARMRPIENGIIHYNESLNSLKKNLESIDLAGGEVKIAGTVPINVSFRNLSMKDLRFIFPFVLLFIFGTLFFIFRSVYVLFLSAFALIVSISSAMGIGGYLGFKLSMIVSMVPCIIAAITLADTVHLISSYLSLRKKDGHQKALEFSLRKNMFPTFLTSVTTALGFIGLATSLLSPIRSMGVLSAIGVMLGWVFTLGVVAPLISLYSFNASIERFEKKWNAKPFVDAILSKAWPVFFSCVALFALGFWGSSQNKVNSNIIKYFAKDLDVRVANEFLQSNVGGYSGVQIVIDTKNTGGIKSPTLLKKVSSLLHELNGDAKITKVVSLIDILKKTNRALKLGNEDEYRIPDAQDEVAQQLFLYGLSIPQGKSMDYWHTPDYSAMRVDVLWTVDDSEKAIQMIAWINGLIKKYDIPAKVTGKAALLSGLDKYIVSTFVSSALLAVALVSLMMMLIFRSFWIGIFSMIPNVLPPLLGLSFLTILGHNLDVGVVLIVAVCMGIAVDDTIYFLINYKKEIETQKDIKEALIEVLSSSGRSLVYTSSVLIFGFISFALGDFIPNRNFGLITALVLFFALLADLVFLPVLIYLKDRSTTSNL